MVSGSSGGNLKYLLALLLLLPSAVFASCKDAQLNKLSKETGIKIHCDFNHKTYFPKSLLHNCGDASGIDPEYDSSLPVSDSIRQFLNNYPKQVLSNHLENIFILSKFKCGNYRMGGSYDRKSIYVSVYLGDMNEQEYYRSWYLKILHHEFSSILQEQNYSLLTNDLIQSVSGKDAYDPKILEYCLLQIRGECISGSRTLYEKGFLHYYGKQSPENDFNIYAEYLFVEYERLMGLADRYPLIDKKVKLFKKFYNDIGVHI